MSFASTFNGFRYNWPTWTFCGINPPKKRRFLYVLYRVWFIVFLITGCSVTLFAKLIFADDFKTLFSSLASCGEIIVAGAKLSFIFMKLDMLKSLEADLLELDNFSKMPEQRCQRKKIVRKCHTIFKVLITLSGIIWLASGVAIARLITQKALLYPAWFPFNWENSVALSVLVALYQFVGAGGVLCFNACNDTVPAILFSITQGHYQCLAIRLDAFESGTPENIEDNYRDLVDCIRYHQKIESFFQTIEKLISTQVFIQLLATAVVLCSSAAVILFCEADTLETVYFGVYGLGIMIEVSVACAFGTIFEHQTEILTTQLYSCNWTDQSRRFKRDLLIFMVNSMQPNIVLAGNIFPVTLDTFFSIVKGSYSLLAVIKGMQ